MYKWVLKHDVLPGKFHDMKAWFLQQDAERKARGSNYTSLNRYTTVFGRVHEVIGEVEQETFPEEQWDRGWTSGYATVPAEGPQASFLQLIVPGNSTLSLLKQLELDLPSSPHSVIEQTTYKVVLTHEVLPGKLSTLASWFSAQDNVRTEQDAAYRPPRRFITIFGDVHQVVIEAALAGPPHQFVARGYAEHPVAGPQEEFLHLIVPGRSTMAVWKNIT